MSLKKYSPMALLGWLLNINEHSSGKRQIAGVVAIFTLCVIVWRLPHLTDGSQRSIIEWLIIGTLALIAAAFGMESIIKQAGLKFGVNTSADAPKPLPEPEEEDEIK